MRSPPTAATSAGVVRGDVGASIVLMSAIAASPTFDLAEWFKVVEPVIDQV
jgi:hypothetical protein